MCAITYVGMFFKQGFENWVGQCQILYVLGRFVGS